MVEPPVTLTSPEPEQIADRKDLLNYTGLSETATTKEVYAAALNKVLEEIRSQRAITNAALIREPGKIS